VEAWRNDPEWDTSRKSLRDRGQFAHTVLGLATGTILSPWGNDVGLQRTGYGKRTADMVCVVDASERLAIEIKVPRRFEVAGTPLTAAEAERIVRSAFESAGTGRQGQLSPEHPGMPVIGGFHVGRESIERLREAACRHIGGRPPHVAAVMVLSLGFDVNGPSGATSSMQLSEGESAAVAVLHEVHPQPWVSGPHCAQPPGDGGIAPLSRVLSARGFPHGAPPVSGTSH